MPHNNWPGWTYDSDIEYGRSKGLKIAKPGLYDVRVTDVTPKPANTNKPMLLVQLEIVEARQPGLQDGIGARCFENFLLVTGETWRIEEFCAVLGVDPPESARTEDVIAFCQRIDGATLAAHLRVSKTPDGRDRNEVVYFGETPSDRQADGKSNGDRRGDDQRGVKPIGGSKTGPGRPAAPSGKASARR